MELNNILPSLFQNHSTFQSVVFDFISSRFSHGHLFLNSDRVLSNSFAMAIAQMIVCSSHSNCGVCEGCMLAKKQTHPDILVYPKGEKFLVSDSGSIVEQSFVKPMISDTKVFVLLDFQNANETSQNKLLKILEEPPKNVVFLVAASNEANVLLTVRSRLSKSFVSGFSPDQLKKVLSLQTANSQLIEEAIFASGNNVGQAMQYIQSKASQLHFQFAKKIVCEMVNSSQILPFSKELSKEKENFVLKLNFLNTIFAKMLEAKSIPNMLNLTELVQANQLFSETAILNIIQLMHNAKKQADSFVSLPLVCDKLLFGLLEVKYKWK